MAELDINQIRRMLPHRYPFLLLDRVTDYEAGASLTAIKNVTINESFFQGHFPQRPIMPGVLIVEAMAQAAALLGLVSGAELEPGQLYYLAGVDKARFRKTVVPGDQLVIEARLLAVRRNLWRFACVAKTQGRLVADAELLTTVAGAEA